MRAGLSFWGRGRGRAHANLTLPLTWPLHGLQRKALVARVRALIEAKGLYSADAFNVFDADRTGTISCSELAAALAWLGLQLPPEPYPYP